MAEWKTRGYVVDSDEDEDSQGSGNGNTATSPRFPNPHDEFHKAQKKADEDLAEGPSTVTVVVSRDGFIGEDGNGVDGVEKQHWDNALNHGNAAEAADSAGHREEKIPAAYGSPSAFEAYDIEELQQDHYPSPHVPLAPTSPDILPLPSPNQPPIPSVSTDKHALSTSPPPEDSPSPASQGLERQERRLQDRSQGHQDDIIGGHKNIQTSDIVSVVVGNLNAANAQSDSRAGRALRHRNPIQLHPYAIEGEKYRQVFKARGMKPLRIETQDESWLDTAEDSQMMDNEIFTGYRGEVARQTPDIASSSPLSKHISTSETFQEPSSNIELDDGEEFPDVDALLHAHPKGVTTNGFKRRKIAHTFSKKHQRAALGVVASASRTTRDPSQGEEVSNLFDAPASPPPSNGSYGFKKRTRAPRFKMPRGLSPVALPTPLASSEPRRRPAFDLLEAESSGGDDALLFEDDESEASSDPDESASEEQSPNELQQVQRRMRGVLPASWLKLDLKKRTKPSNNGRGYQRMTSCDLKSPQRGIARRRSTQKSMSPSIGRAIPLNLSDAEESDSQNDDVYALNDIERIPERPRSNNIEHWLEDDRFSTSRLGEVEEDNRIDEMLLTEGRRSTFTKKPRTKAKVKLKGRNSAGRVPSGIQKPTHRSSNHQPTVNRPSSGKRIKQRVRRPVRVGILDSTTLARPSDPSIPQFLKLALRTARARNDKGRQSPSRKHLKLASVTDSREVEQTLADWREGRIKQRAIIRSQSSRTPLANRAGNNETLPQLATDVVRASKVTKTSGYSKGASSTRPGKLQQTLDKVVARSAINQGHEPKIRKFKYAMSDGSLTAHKKSGHIMASVGLSSDTRPAMLEGLPDESHIYFRQGLSEITRLQQGNPRLGTRPPRKRNPRRLSIRSIRDNLGTAGDFSAKEISQAQGLPDDGQHQRPIPRRLADVHEPTFPHNMTGSHNMHSQNILLSLECFDENHVGFDVEHLPVGARFDKSTFIGSGDFRDSIKPENYEAMCEARDVQEVVVCQETHVIGPWNERTASRLQDWFDTICEGIRDLATSSPSIMLNLENAVSVAHSITHYFSRHLSFVDAVDRVAFVRSSTCSLDAIVEGFTQISHSSCSLSASGKHQDLQILLGMYTAVIAYQLRRIANHELVASSMEEKISHLLSTSIEQNLRTVLVHRFGAFQLYASRLSLANTDKTSTFLIRDSHQPIQALVASYHIILRTHGTPEAFWAIVNEVLSDACQADQLDARGLEQCWRYTLYLLPFLELSTYGNINPDQSQSISCENWKTIRPIIDTVIGAYNEDPSVHSPKVNAYCRKVYARCFYLIKDWHWTSCSLVLGVLFDFFAQNGLAHLRQESNWGNHGSPAFLERLDESPSLGLSHGDRCFHILLKTIGVVLLGLRGSTDSRTTQNLIFRLMPNHGRYLPKDRQIDLDVLDALRNHHDLLCTLYWASPPRYRPRLRSLCDLVDMHSSHPQACQLNIRAWLRLVKFQLSTEEPLESLQPFADWHTNILESTLGQHDTARTYGETEAHQAGYGALDKFNRLEITSRILQHELVIFHNEFEAEVIVIDALKALEVAIKRAPNNEAASKLMKQSLVLAFQRLDLSLRQRNNVVMKALDVVLAYTQRCKAGLVDIRSGGPSDESQDFGDWSAYEDDDALDDSVLRMLEGPIRTLLSDCFGAEIIPKDDLLSKCVDCHASLASILVSREHRSWDDYLSPFGQCSWENLSRTSQSQKYHPYYQAKILELNRGIYAAYREHFIKTWLIVMVEREASIKYQHVLTNSILNAGYEDRLLYNPPFCTSSGSGRFDITAKDFLQGRLSLVCMILCNMREAVNEASCESPAKVSMMKQQFKEWLKAMMGAMKRKYLETGQHLRTGGAFVEFVQAIIQALHKNTSNICPVDKFFTDPSEFPPPASDPAYTVAQIQSYGLRLHDPKIAKQLAAFLQSLSEQAVKDDQQANLADRLHSAMSDDFEFGDAASPTLRSFMIMAIIPAYLVVGFGHPNGFVLLVPFLKALRMVFGDLFTAFSANKKGSVASVVSMLSTFVQDLWLAWPVLSEGVDFLRQRHILHLLGECYITVTALLPVLDYIRRLHESTEQAMDIIGCLKVFAKWSLDQARDYQEVHDLRQDRVPVFDPTYTSVRTFAQKELERSLQHLPFPQTALERGQRLSVQERRTTREQYISLGSYQEEMGRYEDAARDFLDSLEIFRSFGVQEEEISGPRRGLGLNDVMI